MARETYVWDRQTHKMIPKHLAPVPKVARSDLPCPMVISDHLDDVVNPADGQRYSSKSAYYKAVRAKGCEIVGNETPRAAPKAEMSDPIDDIRRAMAQHSTPTKRRRRKAHG